MKIEWRKLLTVLIGQWVMLGVTTLLVTVHPYQVGLFVGGVMTLGIVTGWLARCYIDQDEDVFSGSDAET